MTVFVSSTAQDLQPYRKAAGEVINTMKWRPEMMEDFEAQPGCTVDACRGLLEKCDVMLLIVAWRQGWVPTQDQGGNGQDSITAMELAHARNKNIPILALLANGSWPGDKWEEEPAKRQWIRGFRDGLNQVAGFFGDEEDQGLPRFRAALEKTLLSHKERMLASQERALSGHERGGPAVDFFSGICKGLFEGRGIPVLGGGIFGDGPLSSKALAKALLNRAGGGALEELSRERLSLATAAEYRERVELTREQFLEAFRRILEYQSREAAPPAILDLLASIDRLKVIISTTYDQLLEERLQRAGRKYVVVSHVRGLDEGASTLFTGGGEKDEAPAAGKVIVLRPGRDAQFCRADLLSVEPDECIVYRPLGTPLLHGALDPELGIDTVVITETDHAGFLQRLESPETGVPSPIKARFMRQPLLFLGYTMDIWQYRLTMRIFRASRRDESRVPTLAVRVPDDEIEEVAWNRVSAQLIRMDLGQFARLASESALATGKAGSRG